MNSMKFTPCLLCGLPFQEIHHIIPKKAGGSDKDENLIPLCHKCHRKGRLHSRWMDRAVELLTHKFYWEAQYAAGKEMPTVPGDVYPETPTSSLLHPEMPGDLLGQPKEFSSKNVRPFREITCVGCGIAFQTFHMGQKYCNSRCRDEIYKQAYIRQQAISEIVKPCKIIKKKRERISYSDYFFPSIQPTETYISNWPHATWLGPKAIYCIGCEGEILTGPLFDKPDQKVKCIACA